MQSIINQSFKEFEIIVVDDGCTDGSVAVIERFEDERVKVIRQVNAGPGAARNTGALAASAPYLAFLDADDEWKPDFLRIGMQALCVYPEAVGYVCGYDALGYHIKNRVAAFLTTAQLLPPPKSNLSSDDLRNRLDAMHTSAVIVRRQEFDATSGFFSEGRCMWGEDSFLWIQILFAGFIYWDPTANSIYHLENSSLGFAVRHKTSARPISLHKQKLLANVPQAHVATLTRLAQDIARQDASDLVQAGYFTKAWQVRTANDISNGFASISDLSRFWSRISRRLLGARPTQGDARKT